MVKPLIMTYTTRLAQRLKGLIVKIKIIQPHWTNDVLTCAKAILNGSLWKAIYLYLLWDKRMTRLAFLSLRSSLSVPRCRTTSTSHFRSSELYLDANPPRGMANRNVIVHQKITHGTMTNLSHLHSATWTPIRCVLGIHLPLRRWICSSFRK